jgi:hypothetical protein
MSFSVLLGVLKKKYKMSEKKLNPLILFYFCEKRKNVGIMKKYHVLIFLLKKRKEYFFVVFFFVKIVLEIVRKKNLSMMRVIYQAANVTKAW